MAKGIIIVDVPEGDCRGCIFCWEVKNTGHLECAARILQDVTDGRPEWRPIKPVPLDRFELLSPDSKEMFIVRLSKLLDDTLNALQK